MKVELKRNSCVVTKESGDMRIGSESQLLHHIKRELQKQGHDVIKKRMWRDGHMVDDYCQYIRERKGKFGIWNADYAITDIAEEFRKTGQTVLNVAGLNEER